METARQVWQSDNGGAVHLGGGANAWPLRGGYFNNWEGGVRVAALVSGGFLPDHVRGTKLQEPIHEADWCACCSPPIPVPAMPVGLASPLFLPSHPSPCGRLLRVRGEITGWIMMRID
jgi:hypothetical protein